MKLYHESDCCEFCNASSEVTQLYDTHDELQCEDCVTKCPHDDIECGECQSCGTNTFDFLDEDYGRDR